ncbi:MAG: copper-binding protein, partial [Rhodomicrobiaceae bacterium]
MRTGLNRAAVIAALIGLAASPAIAAGDLAIKGQKLPDLEIGTGNAGYGLSQKKYELETGKAYRLKLKGTGKQECKLRGPEFFSSIYV